ncbi:MAG: hypothetical protein IJT73_07790 [Selenomonadaceae bacterium]|nr:hypothetical protein [Selenomonadaceae bacterium]
MFKKMILPTVGKVFHDLTGAGVEVHKANCEVEIAKINAVRDILITGAVVGGVCYVVKKGYDLLKDCKEGDFNFQCANFCANAKVKN